MRFDMTDWQARIDAKLCSAVARKLNVTDVLIHHCVTVKGGATVPVFQVPASVQAQAIALGLTVVA